MSHGRHRLSDYALSELARLRALGGPVLYPAFVEPVEAYFAEHQIEWWGGKGPTGSPISSQISCINHLDPARTDREVARALAKCVVPECTDVAEIDGGFLAYEWIGEQNYLGERRWSPLTRGKNVTSLDAVLVAIAPDESRILIAIEWKYTESYSSDSVAISRAGTNRVDTYRSLLERADSPIVPGDLSRLFFEPYYQLMRQTLLAWQMAEHGEHQVSDWRHVLVSTAANTALLGYSSAQGMSELEQRWRSELRRPDRFSVLTPKELSPKLGSTEGDDGQWRAWLNQRYET